MNNPPTAVGGILFFDTVSAVGGILFLDTVSAVGGILTFSRRLIEN